MERQIGAPGEFLDGSMASRAVNIRPDMRKVRQLDTFHRDYRRYLWRSMAAVAGLLAVVVVLALFGHFKTAFAVGCITYAVFLFGWRFRKMLTGDAYRNGLLVPGIITALNPLRVTVVAEVENGDGQNPRGIVWGVKHLTIPALTMHPEQLGEPVPCVALFGASDDGIYTDYEPRPLAWGTADAAVIEAARAAIAPDEWELTALLAERTPPTEGEYSITFFNDELEIVPGVAPVVELKTE
ncbi:DUF3239 domain-containing protein [Hymenobacter actinosclerus]|uniref:DUF3239 domain-containing protein n=1 Tax=Hymenobacter actinosclerus TaxID=82805 RepID=A0A1I0A8B7_9BACT|nr:DUF3239 domain-containing protein [Hymenobacter actinosclerus]SES90411.1 Protein of unknown function [Hymenobacter actinosclerus]